MTVTQDLNAFSFDYAAAREKFCTAAESAGAQLERYDNPGKAPDGGSLSSDVAILGDTGASRVLLVNAGTHGVEAFAGSAIEIGLLGAGHIVPDNVRVVLIHAINPHGFAWLRRVTEENVDLNRNFLDHDGTRPTNSDYDTLHPVLCPERWDDRSRARSNKAIEDYARKHGAFALQTVVTRGQYDHPDGIFFGGQATTWSNRTFRAITEKHLAGTSLIAFIDLHTGLGHYGSAEMLAGASRDSPNGRRLHAWYGDALTSPHAATPTSAPLRGVIARAVREAANGADVVSATLEFGTYPVRVVLDALQADNWVHAHGDPASADGQTIKAQTRKALYPDEDDWKELVLVRGRQILNHALAGLGAD